jgi:hypothetical protein
MNDERLILRIALATELGAGILLGLGLFTPPAGVLLVTVTATLVFVSWPHEYPLYLLFVAVAIALIGGTGTLGVGLGLAGAVMLEGVRQLTRQRGAEGGSVASAVATAEQENP